MENQQERNTKMGMATLIVSLLTLLLVAFQIISLPQSVKSIVANNEAMKVGGAANYAKLQQLYMLPGFSQQQGQGIDAALTQMQGQTAQPAAQPTTTTTTPAANDQPQFAGGTLTPAQLAQIKAGAYVEGSKDAAVTIVEYSDPACPYCIRQFSDKTIDTVMAQYGTKVNHIYKVVQGVNHPTTQYKSLAILCAGKLGGSTAYVGLYTDILSHSTPEAAVATGEIAGYAKQLGLNATKLASCISNGDTQTQYAANWQEALGFGANGTPGNLVINNKTGEWKLIAGAYPSSNFTPVIDAMLK